MNKLKVFMLAAASVCGLLASAQDPTATQPVDTLEVEFAPHWFIQPQIGAAYTLGEHSFGYLISPAASISAGYSFNPLWSVRAGVSGWQAKGNATYDFRHHPYRFNYIQISADAVFDWVNCIWGWNPERKITGYAMLGIGANDRFYNNEAIAIGNDGYPYRHLWHGHKWSFAGRGGIGGNYRMSDVIDINAEVNVSGLTDHFNSKYGHGGNIDWQFNALIGVTIHIGDRVNADIVKISE